MMTRIALIALATLMTTSAAIVPTASAGPCELGAVCVNSEDCRVGAVCVNSDGCHTGAVCVGSERCRLGAVCVNDEDCRLGAVCIGSLKSYALTAAGNVWGNAYDDDGTSRPCSSTAVVSLQYNTGSWKYSQLFASSVGPNEAPSCSDGLVTTNRQYSDADSTLLVSGDTWTIFRYTDSPFGFTKDVTRITFVDGGAVFEQSVTAEDGRPLWEAGGFLASPQAL